jgi:hypothetical protein
VADHGKEQRSWHVFVARRYVACEGEDVRSALRISFMRQSGRAWVAPARNEWLGTDFIAKLSQKRLSTGMTISRVAIARMEAAAFMLRSVCCSSLLAAS